MKKIPVLGWLGVLLTSLAVIFISSELPDTSMAEVPGSVLTDAKASQTKVVQGSVQDIAVEFVVETPGLSVARTARQATDVVVVLDRSGSMAAENKLPYAKQAIQALVERLAASDRFALVEFDSVARTAIPLSAVMPEVRSRITSTIQSLHPGSSTNMGDGLQHAIAIFRGNLDGGGRAKKVIVLSDGQTNVGVVDPAGLSALARELSGNGVIVSTIGLGLDFNEVVLASLADSGMGTYAYLESPVGLDAIFAKELTTTRELFAHRSELEIRTLPGVAIKDVSGLPLEYVDSGRTHVRVPTGQLLSGSRRSIFATLSVPTTTEGTVELASLQLRYQTPSGPPTILAPRSISVEVVPAARADEVASSVDGTLYKNTWLSNNLGRMQKQFSEALRKGDRQGAADALGAYRAEAASAPAPSRELQSEMLSEVRGKSEEMEKVLEDAFDDKTPGSERRKARYAKEIFSSGYQNQTKH